MKDVIKNRLLAVATSLAVGASGALYVGSQPSAEVVLAMELGAYFESSGKHIGKPYVDRVGKGRPLTVCNGVTGPEVVAGRYYSPADCKRLELPRYLDAERAAKRLFKHWSLYNVWVRASIIDMIYNLGEAAVAGSSMRVLANAGNLAAACSQMTRWVYGTVSGQRVVLNGLVDRRQTTSELCSDWGRDGHFSAGVLARNEVAR